MKKMFNEGNQLQIFKSSSGSGKVNNYCSGSDFLTSYGSGSASQTKSSGSYGSGSTTLLAGIQFFLCLRAKKRFFC
jgi:hypothetical protein